MSLHRSGPPRLERTGRGRGRRLKRWLTRWLTRGFALAALPALPPGGVAAQMQGPPSGEAGAPLAGSLIPLECRLGRGPWQPCRMQIEEVGMHWTLLIGEQRMEFIHDGRGGIRLRQDGRWRPVTGRWEDTSLCWDGVCARGDIPLD